MDLCILDLGSSYSQLHAQAVLPTRKTSLILTALGTGWAPKRLWISPLREFEIHSKVRAVIDL
jgi:hypothetical protein